MFCLRCVCVDGGALAVSLPQMVASSSMDGESVGLLRDYVNELLQCVCSLFVDASKLTVCADGW